MTEKDENKAQKGLAFTLTAVTGLVGCITIVITIAALLLGLWLDARFDTKPTITLALTIASLPVTLIVMFYAVRKTTNRLMNTVNEDKDTNNVEEELG